MKDINVVIPASGRGQRFAVAGYKKPKPFIDLFGKPMLRRVIENIGLSANYYVVFLESFLTEYKTDIEVALDGFDVRIITVPEVTQGPTCTILAAKEYINNEKPLITANCDQLVGKDDCKFLDALLASELYDGVIPCFKSDSPKWSYVKADGFRVTDIQEKKVISNLATIGLYGFLHGYDFVKYAEKQIKNNNRSNNEFYVSGVYQEMLKDNRNIGYTADFTMVDLGVPESMEKYIATCKNN